MTMVIVKYAVALGESRNGYAHISPGGMRLSVITMTCAHFCAASPYSCGNEREGRAMSECIQRPHVIVGDCRKTLWEHGPFDLLIADPPYGDTSLAWDKHCHGWIQAAEGMLARTGSLWHSAR